MRRARLAQAHAICSGDGGEQKTPQGTRTSQANSSSSRRESSRWMAPGKSFCCSHPWSGHTSDDSALLLTARELQRAHACQRRSNLRPVSSSLAEKTNVVGSPRKSLVPFAFASARRREKGETRPSSRHLQRAQVEGTKKRSRGPEQAKQTPRHRAEKAHANEASGRQTEGSVL